MLQRPNDPGWVYQVSVQDIYALTECHPATMHLLRRTPKHVILEFVCVGFAVERAPEGWDRYHVIKRGSGRDAEHLYTFFYDEKPEGVMDNVGTYTHAAPHRDRSGGG